MKQYLAIDIGGTSVKLGLVDETGGILAKAEESVSFDGWQTPILTTVLAAAERWALERGARSPRYARQFIADDQARLGRGEEL